MSEVTSVRRPWLGAPIDIRYADEMASLAGLLRRFDLNHVELCAGYLGVQPDKRDAERLRTVAEEFDTSYTVRGLYLDAVPRNVNEHLRNAAVAATREMIELTAIIDAGDVVAHRGSVQTCYPGRVRKHTHEQMVRALREYTELVTEVGVSVCFENQCDKSGTCRHTATPGRLAAFLDSIGVDDRFLKLTLGVGHTEATGVDYERFVERFDNHIQVTHLRDNDGTEDARKPSPSFRSVAADIDVPYGVLGVKSRADAGRCMSGTDA